MYRRSFHTFNFPLVNYFSMMSYHHHNASRKGTGTLVVRGGRILPRSIEPERRCRYRYSCTCRQARPGYHTTLVFALGCVHSSGTSSIFGGESPDQDPDFRIAFGHTSSLFLASPRLSPRQAQDVLGAGVGRLTSWNWLPPALRSIFSFGGAYWYPVS